MTTSTAGSMTTWLDGQRLDGAGQTLGEALATAGELLVDRLVVEAVADEYPVPVEHLTEPPGDVPYARELRLVSAKLSDLVSQSLADGEGTLDQLTTMLRQAAQAVALGEIKEGMQCLHDALALWEQVQSTVDVVLKAEPARAYRISENEIEDAARLLLDRLGQVRQCIEMEDWSELTDLLEIDMGMVGQRWQQLLRRLSDAGAAEERAA